WYISDACSAPVFSVTPAFKFTIFGEASAATRAKFVDFDGDGRTDISVFRPDNGIWYALRSTDNTVTAQQFGIRSDKLAPGDYDADGKPDVAVYRSALWYRTRSRDGLAVAQFGLRGDGAQTGDYAGVGLDDL